MAGYSEKPPTTEMSKAIDKFGRLMVDESRCHVAMLKTLENRLRYLELVVWLDTAVLFVVGLVALHVL